MNAVERRKEIEAVISDVRKMIEPMIAGRMTMWEQVGNSPRRDITQETIERNMRVIATYEKILAADS